MKESNEKIKKFNLIVKSVCDVFKISEKDIASISRTRRFTDARIVITWNAEKAGIPKKITQTYLSKTRNMIYHMLKMYENYYKYNNDFRNMADRVIDKIENRKQLV